MSNCNREQTLSQYVNSPKFQGWLNSFSDRALEVCAAYNTLELFFDIDSASGEWLDLLGVIIGQPREVIDGSAINFFSHDNLDPLTSGFNVGKFWNGQYVGAMQNLLTYSEDLSAAAWSGLATVSQDGTIAPNSTEQAWLVSQAVANDNLRNVVSLVDDGSTYTFSWYAKKGSGALVAARWISYSGGTTQDYQNTFDMDTLSWVSALNGDNRGYEEVADGWVRIWVTATQNNTGNTLLRLDIGGSTSDTLDFYAWGAQINEGELRPYLKTVSSPIISQENIIQVDDIDYRKLIKARAFKNASGATIEDILTAVFLLTGRTDCYVLDGGLGDSASITPDLMTYSLEFTSPIEDDDRYLILALDLLPRPAGVQLDTVIP